LLVGVVLYLIDWKNIQNNKRNYWWVYLPSYIQNKVKNYILSN
jgi:hypothetical protein